MVVKLSDKYSKSIKHISDYILKNYPQKYAFLNVHQKYNVCTVVEEIIYLLKTGISYNNYRGLGINRRLIKFRQNMFCP
jgi:hypothetical protein